MARSSSRSRDTTVVTDAAGFIGFQVAARLLERGDAATDLDNLNDLEQALGWRAEKRVLSAQPGDVLVTCADVDDLSREFDFTPSTPIAVRLRRFVECYRGYYRV